MPHCSPASHPNSGYFGSRDLDSAFRDYLKRRWDFLSPKLAHDGRPVAKKTVGDRVKDLIVLGRSEAVALMGKDDILRGFEF